MGQLAAKQNQASGSYSGLLDLYQPVANLFRTQEKLSRVADATERLIQAIVVSQGRLTRNQKASLLKCVVGTRENANWLAYEPDPPPASTAADLILLSFAVKLAGHGPYIRANDVASLGSADFEDAAVLEAVATMALGQFLCTLANGLCQPT